MKIKPQNLATLAHKSIQEAISRNQFDKYLPPERQLSESLGVSRPVLRHALAELKKNGIIRLTGKRYHIIAPQQRIQKKVVTHVRLLCRRTWESQANELMQTWEYLATELAKDHLEFHLQPSPICYATNPEKHLKQLTESCPDTCWVLFRTTAAIQKWFDHSKLPAIVLGGTYSGIRLPRIDTDYESICRHAAGLLATRGHQRIAIIKRNALLPGDQESLDSFIKKQGDNTIKITIMEHDGTRESVGKNVDRLLVMKNVPTAWFIFGQFPYYFTVSSRLAQHGFKVGKDIHLICRDFDPYFNLLYPTVACYRRNIDRLKKKLFRMISTTADGGIPRPRASTIIADFIDGESLGSVDAT